MRFDFGGVIPIIEVMSIIQTANEFIPVLPLRSTLIFPETALPLRVGRSKSTAALQAANERKGPILVVAQNSETPDREPVPEDLYRVGTLCTIDRVLGSAEEGFHIVVRGTERFRISELKEENGFLQATGGRASDQFDLDPKTSEALLGSLKVLGNEILELLPVNTRQLSDRLASIENLLSLIYACGINLEIPISEKQQLLENDSVRQRALKLLEFMQLQRNELQIQSEIREKLSQKLGKTQREVLLREQLRTIREELGEGEQQGDEYHQKIENAQMPPDVAKIAGEELKRLETIGNASPEAHVIRNYLDLLCALPWSKSATEEIDLETARAILDQDHYGLEKIKKRILQHLAVMKLKRSGRGSILLFVGPPGVGKTSLGQSIAKALGRRFVRGSLGGVRDDAEIRGHRRTYIGAMPGRIIQAIKRAGQNNPVFMLDEVDKLSRSFQGDPASALLEVLDPEQNSNFLDHYLDVPFDLSKVFFVATANTTESIPAPLLDRMEVIELTGYTTAEKLHIARNHLVPKQLSEHGLTPEQLQIPDETLSRLINGHTREAGVRELQRKIAELCRGSAEQVLKPGVPLPVRIEPEILEDLLGPERYLHESAARATPPGVVTGLAWTPQGGEILFIEASLMPGHGKLTITGQLGEVMKESAQIGLSIVRSKLSVMLPGFDFDRYDLHIHVPAGAIPKDGPSAGITMVTAIASLFSNRSVDPKLAMTGEITLRGAVMPVGGIKEKALAAHRAGMERLILSRRNEKDLRDVPAEVRSKLKFHFVDSISEVLQLALGIDALAAAHGTSPSATPAPTPAAVA